MKRLDDVRRLFVSIRENLAAGLEVIIVDQNEDGLLDALCAEFQPVFPLRHEKIKAAGASRARNHGLQFATGQIINFPDDDYLSPLHAQFLFLDGILTLRDLGSKNGTWIYLDEPHRLTDGDQVLLGSQILRYRRLGYPGPRPPEQDQTRRLGSLTPAASRTSRRSTTTRSGPESVNSE